MTNQTNQWHEMTCAARAVDTRDVLKWNGWQPVTAVDVEQEGRVIAITLDSGSTLRFWGSDEVRVRFMVPTVDSAEHYVPLQDRV